MKTTCVRTIKSVLVATLTGVFFALTTTHVRAESGVVGGGSLPPPTLQESGVVGGGSLPPPTLQESSVVGGGSLPPPTLQESSVVGGGSLPPPSSTFASIGSPIGWINGDGGFATPLPAAVVMPWYMIDVDGGIFDAIGYLPDGTVIYSNGDVLFPEGFLVLAGGPVQFVL